jgi:hypothetical protein
MPANINSRQKPVKGYLQGQILSKITRLRGQIQPLYGVTFAILTLTASANAKIPERGPKAEI